MKSKMQVRVEDLRERVKEIDVDKLSNQPLAYLQGVIQVSDWLLDPETYVDPLRLLEKYRKRGTHEVS